MSKTPISQKIRNPNSEIQNQRILWLTENYPPQRGGMAVSCDRIVRVLRESGPQIDVAHFSRRYVKWKTIQRLGGRQYNCPVREDTSDALNRLWNFVERHHQTAKYTHVAAFGGLLPMIAGPVFSAWLRIPLVTMIRGNDFDSGIFSIKRGDVLRIALENSECVCAVSQDKVEKISLLFPQTKTVWTPNGIDLCDWEFSPEDRRFGDRWREETAGRGKIVLGLFGQLKQKKGGMFFLENLLRSGQVGQFHLLFVGDIETEMREWLGANSGQVCFTHLDFLDRYELLPFYAACDFVVIPSFYDGMPNVLLEAAALGVPAIASRTGGMRDILEHGKTAFFFDPGDDHSCRSAIEKAATADQSELNELKVNCVELARKFDHRSEAGEYIRVFSETAIERSFYAEK